MKLVKKVFKKLYSNLFGLKLKVKGAHVVISNKSILLGTNKIELYDGVVIHDFAKLNAENSKDKGIIIGSNTIIHEFTYIKASDGLIKIGNNSTLNSFCLLYGGEKNIIIGNGVRIATGCSMVGNSHVFSDITKYIFTQGVTSKGIIIEDDVWLGSGVRVLDGVTIGKGSVIGANSVVNKNIPPYSVAVGVPASVIKKRGSKQ